MSWAFGHLSRMYTQALNGLAANGHPGDFRRLGPDGREELLFWQESFTRFNGVRPLWVPTQVNTLLHTDAAGPDSRFSLGGWGAWYTRPGGQLELASGRWPDHDAAADSSTLLELRAAYLGLQSFNRGGALAGQVVRIHTDNQPLTHIVARGGSRKPHNNELAKQLFWYCLEHSITLSARWIPREENQLADELSKAVDGDDWMVNPAVFATLAGRHGPYAIDLFASHTNHQVPAYYSWHNTPDTAGVDAFRFRWGRQCWCNPPFRLVGRVWRHGQTCGAKMTLVVPFWPSAVWWHRLTAGSPTHFASEVRAAEVLPLARDLFLSGASGNAVARQLPPWAILALVVDFAPADGQGDRVEIPAMGAPHGVRGRPARGQAVGPRGMR